MGDLVQIGGNEGKVTHIGIRASTIRFSNGSEVIVPNGSFISDTVTNWTYSDRLRRIDVQVSVLGPADAVRVMDLLKGVAAQEPQINPEPPPQALLIGFVGDAMTFELRCWTSHAEDWPQIRSALTLAVRATLAEHKIPMK